MSATLAPAEPVSWTRRFRFPLTMLCLVALAFIAVTVFDRTDLMPEALFPSFMVFQVTLLLAIITIPAWFFLFSGFRLTTKLLGALVVAGLIYGFLNLFRIEKTEFTGAMKPVFVYRWIPQLTGEVWPPVVFVWNPEAEELLDERLATVRHDATGLTHADLVAGPDDFPRYRGLLADGTAPAVKLGNWSANPPEIIWKIPVGGGYSGVVVAGRVAVTLEQRGDDEAVVCYDRAGGKELWAYAYPAHFKHAPNMGGGGPRATPAIADGDVYSLGALGDLVCLDGTTGKKRWAVNILTDNGAKNHEWGVSGSPLVAGSLVIVNPGVDPAANKGQAIAAYDRKTGKRVWAAGDQPAGYSSPLRAGLGGMEQILLFDGGGLVGLDPADGKELWRFPWSTFSDMNIVQPLVLPGDRVFISSERSNGCVLLHVKKDGDGWSATPVWQNKLMASKFANPVYHQGHIYGLHSGMLCCMDARTGKRVWDGERVGSGQLLLSGDNLIVQTEEGEILAAVAEPTAYRELGRMQVLDGRTWNTPALAGGRLYVRNHKEMACVELPTVRTTAE
jgi:outer membrane protein assembly factor BamB